MWTLKLLCIVIVCLLYGLYRLYAPPPLLPPTQPSRSGARRPPHVACLVFGTAASWANKVRAVNSTWAPHCTHTLFFYSSIDFNNAAARRLAGGTPLPTMEGIDYLLTKTILALKRAVRRLPRQVTWFIKADDDVYINWPNMEALLGSYDATKPQYLGSSLVLSDRLQADTLRLRAAAQDTFAHLPGGLNRTLAHYLTAPYNSGGAAYVLSRPAVSLLLKGTSSGPLRRLGICPALGGLEDLAVGTCLAHMGVPATNVTRAGGRPLFHANNVFVDGGGQLDLSKVEHQRDFVTVHRMAPEHMYLMHQHLGL